MYGNQKYYLHTCNVDFRLNMKHKLKYYLYGYVDELTANPFVLIGCKFR